MIRVSVTVNRFHLEDKELRQLSQLGVDCIDFGMGSSFPGVKEQGYPDLDLLLKEKRRLRSFGLDINRVTLPNITRSFINRETDSEKELENSINALKVFGEAKIPIARQRLEGDTISNVTKSYSAFHRGGAISRGESLGFNKAPSPTPTLDESQHWWSKFCDVYEKLVPIAEDYDIKLGMHPSDTPNRDTAFGSLGYHRIIDAFPSKNVGFIYCIGTRAEEGGRTLVTDEIHHYGRKGRIFLVHFRNVRGSLPTAGAFEEALLDDGDINMFKLLLELHKVGYDGCLNPDHVPVIEGDSPDFNKSWKNSNIGWTYSSNGFAYSIGYIKALLAALAEFAH